MIDINSHLPEPHERSHAYAPDDKGIHIMGRQEIHGDHAPSLNMTLVVDDGDFFNFAVFYIYQGKHIAVAKMPRPLAVEASRL